MSRVRVAFDETGEVAQYRTPSDVAENGLAEVVEAFDELLLLPDRGAVYIALAGIVANYADGDPVWPLLVGPSGCGKTEIVTATTGAPHVRALSSLTPQTLLSGFERKGEPASLLLRIGDFGILAFKDLTTVLTMHREARSQIIGQLREVADGKTEKSFGNGLHVAWEGKLGFLAGVTPVIDEQHTFISLMGERFVLYRMPEVTRAELARRSLARRGVEPELRTKIHATVGEFLAQFVGCGRLTSPTRLVEPLIGLTDVVTRARSGVMRDRYSHDMLHLPLPEAPTRLAKQLGQLAAALTAIGIDEAETWRLVRKVGWDSVPAVRCTILDALGDQVEPVTIAALEQATGLPGATVRRVVEDLAALRLVDRRKTDNRWHVQASAIAHEYWASERFSAMSEGAQHNAAEAAGKEQR